MYYIYTIDGLDKMKTVLLSLVATLSVSLAYGQSGRMDSTMYAAAYNYIKNDSVGWANVIVPSRELIPTRYDMFSNDLDASNNKTWKTLTDKDYARISPKFKAAYPKADFRRLALSKKLEAFDKKSLGDIKEEFPYTFPIINKGNVVKNKQVEKMLLADINKQAVEGSRATTSIKKMNFSKIYYDEFFVGVNCEAVGISGPPGCEVGWFYYFIFNKDKSIRKVYRGEIEYD